MKLFKTVFRRKRGVILFVAAFLFPLFFVVLAGIDTFSKRQKTTRSLLESNLWLSGRSALEQLEQKFDDLEKKRLNVTYLSRLQKEDRYKPINSNPYFFLIDTTYKITFPAIADDNVSNILITNQIHNSEFRKWMDKAKSAELSKYHFSESISNYKKCLSLARTKQQEALAIEGLARSNLGNKNYKKAIQFYRLLHSKYNQTKNLAGHPYGLTAPLQLYTINKIVKESIYKRDSLYRIYQMMLNRHWLISPSCYSFFKGEYESVLEIKSSWEETEFEKVLKWNRFIRNQLIPIIKEREKYAAFNKNDDINRAYLETEQAQYLISFKKLDFPESGNTSFAGICWNLDSLKTNILPGILTNLEKDTKLELRLVNDKNIDIFTNEPVNISKESLSLSFNTIPFPWTLVAIQPGYNKLESDAKTQLIVYGLLILIIIVLMLFAVYIFVKDIGRETDSMLLQTEFVHNVSHELKTPLSLIRLYGETLLFKDNLSEKDRKEGLQIITKESERLSHMINNILDFSKIEMGKKEFELRPGNLADVVENTLDSYRYHLEKKGFEIKLDIDKNIPEVLFDRSAVEGILINLFSNAIKFSDKIKKVVISLKKTIDSIVLEVADKGIGIPEKELKNIFNRFYRVKVNSDFEARGSGLGLTLVKHVADAHGWQVTVKSKPGMGTTFSINIPCNSNKEK